jgi:hypothetical protein
MVPYLNEIEVPEMNDVARVSYGSLHRFAWASFVAWIVFACIHGYGGIIFIYYLLNFSISNYLFFLLQPLFF